LTKTIKDIYHDIVFNDCLFDLIISFIELNSMSGIIWE